MKRISALVCTGMIAASYAFAQTPPVTQTAPVVGAATPAARPQRAPDPQLGLDYNNMLQQLHITTPLRSGKDGNNKQSPNYANYDEAKANQYTNYPDPLVEKSGKKVTTAKEWWDVRRPQIVEDFDREVYGRVPKNIPKVTWMVDSTVNEKIGATAVTTKYLTGKVDNSSYPAISVNIKMSLSVPVAATHPVPVIMQFGQVGNRRGFGGPPAAGAPGATGAAPAGAGAIPARAGAAAGAPARAGAGAPAGFGGGGKSWKEQVLEKGWACASLDNGSIQPDNGAGLTKGIIGLVNKGQFRKPDDWGALRAWAWGADRALDYFETDKSVNAKEVAIEGHSRNGKGALLALAYNPRMATAYVSSSGEAGAKPSRRTTGEIVENITGTSEYHWMAGNFLKYGGPLNPGDLPVDSHELIAMCAPRPVFISGGSSGYDGQDAWVDAPGMFMASNMAGPVYTLLGKRAMPIKEYPGPLVLVPGDITFRQHSGPHTDTPNWPFFLEFASLYFK